MLRSLFAVLLVLSAVPAVAAPLKLVATFTVLGDIVHQVGGEDVTVTTLVGPGGDAHAYQPKPGDAKALAGADLVVVNGLGMEGWIDRLIEASGYKGRVVVASAGVAAIKGEDDHGHGGPGHQLDPHAWQAAPNAKVYASNILRALTAADPVRAPGYTARYDAFAAAVDQVDNAIRAVFADIPRADRKIVTSHDAFGYYGHAYGVTFLAPSGISADAEPSAKAVARLIRQIKAQKVRAVFVETVSDPRLLDQIGRESGARIGGAVYSDALSAPDGPAATYLDMMRHNLAAFAKALEPGS